jgi:hypothetical protein
VLNEYKVLVLKMDQGFATIIQVVNNLQFLWLGVDVGIVFGDTNACKVKLVN